MANAWSVIDNSKSKNEVTRNAWRKALDVLGPSDRHLQHGLELHANILTCDHFGFLPTIWTKEYIDFWQELKKGNVGARELARRTEFFGGVAATRDEGGAGEFITGIRSGGVKCIVETVGGARSRDMDIQRMALSRQNCRVFRKYLRQVGSPEELREANADGVTGVIWSVNGPPLVGKLMEEDEEFSFVETWYQLGVRLMHLTYNRRNFVGSGCAEPKDGGLSELGRALLARMNQVGIIVDTPHSGKQTTLDAAEASSKPIMASHTAAEAVFRHIRCKSDRELKAIAGTDGLIGVYVIPTMLGPNADLNLMLDHVEHIAKLVGPGHVAIGTDVKYIAEWPEEISGYENARFKSTWWGNWTPQNHPLPSSDEAAYGSLAWTNFPLYTVGLVMRGYSDDDIRKIMGENFMRVLEANRPDREVRL